MPLLGVAAGFALLAAHLQNGPRAGPSASDESSVDLILLDVLYDHLRLDTALPALQDAHGKRFLPLRQLATALGFRLHIEAGRRLASGFLGTPTDRIALNGLTGKYVHNGQPGQFDPSLCFERDTDLYLDSEVLSRIAGLHFSWRLDRLELDVTSDAPLAIEQQWIQRQILLRQSGPQVLPKLPVVPNPYSFLSVPSLDFQWYSDATVQDKATESQSRLQVEGSGDLLFMSAHYRYISASAGEPAATLLTLGREDPHGDLLGPMHATQFSFGDLNLPQVPLFARTRDGLGATISNYPLVGQGSAPNQLDGHAPPHSTVELYRGSELLSTVRTDDQGHYVFGAIALETGPNDVRVVVITPDGDVQEEQRTLYGDASGPQSGQSQYRLTATHVGESLIPKALTSLSQEQQRLEYIGEYRYGFTNSSWLSSTAAEASGEAFAGLGLHTWSGENLFHLDSMLSQNGGGALSAGISRRIGTTMVSLDQTVASKAFGDNFAPEIGSNATQVTELRLDGSSPNHGRPLGYGVSIDRMNGSDPSTLVRARLNGGDAHLFVANTIALWFSHAPVDMTGLLQLRKQVGPSISRLDIGYGLGSERPLQTMQLTMDRGLGYDYRLRYGLDYDVTRPGGLETVSALYRMFGPLEFGLNLALDSRGALKANLLLSVGMEGDESAHSVALARPGAADAGSIEVRAYLDKNLDGKFDPGDTLLPNVGFKVAGRPTVVKTGPNGTCYLDRLVSDEEVSVSLDDDSFDDPCWAPASPGVLVIPRTGHLIHLDFGVIESAEIEGVAENADKLPDGLTAELVNSAGKVVQTSVVDDDDSYVFSQVRPGTYTVKLVDNSGVVYGQRLCKAAAGALIRGFDIKVTPPKSR